MSNLFVISKLVEPRVGVEPTTCRLRNASSIYIVILIYRCCIRGLSFCSGWLCNSLCNESCTSTCTTDAGREVLSSGVRILIEASR